MRMQIRWALMKLAIPLEPDRLVLVHVDHESGEAVYRDPDTRALWKARDPKPGFRLPRPTDPDLEWVREDGLEPA